MKKLSYERKKSYVGLIFISAWLVGFIYFFVVPFIYSFIYSLSTVSFSESGINLNSNGLTNYINIIASRPDFIRGLTSQLLLIGWQTPLVVIFSIFISIMLNSKFKGKTAFRGIFFLPVIIATGTLMGMLSETSAGFSGSMSSASSSMFSGLQFQDILLSAGISKEIVDIILNVVNGIFNIVWRSGVQLLLFIAALQAIPISLYEAARVEGATGWETFWKITFPVISPTTILCIFFTIVEMSNDNSLGIVKFIRAENSKANFANASTMSVLWFLIIIALTGFIFFVSRKLVYYLDD